MSGRERLLALIQGYAAAITSDFGWCMVRAEDQDLSPAMSARINEMKSEIDRGIRQLIREGIEDGSIRSRDPKMTLFALAGAPSTGSHLAQGGRCALACGDRRPLHRDLRPGASSRLIVCSAVFAA
ncbi:MAG: hypothetical protein U1F11_09910 [Steroidobacteraceae bacterium]